MLIYISNIVLNAYPVKIPYPVLSLFPSFSLPDVLCDLTDLICRKGSHLSWWLVVEPFHQMVPKLRFSEVFLDWKTNTRWSVHSPQDYFIITLIISDWRDWHDTRGKWSLARNLDRSWWQRHTSLTLRWSQLI